MPPSLFTPQKKISPKAEESTSVPSSPIVEETLELKAPTPRSILCGAPASSSTPSARQLAFLEKLEEAPDIAPPDRVPKQPFQPFHLCKGLETTSTKGSSSVRIYANFVSWHTLPVGSRTHGLGWWLRWHNRSMAFDRMFWYYCLATDCEDWYASWIQASAQSAYLLYDSDAGWEYLDGVRWQSDTSMDATCSLLRRDLSCLSVCLL